MRAAERLRRELAELERRSQLRSLELAQALDFSSNDYLGLAIDPRLKQAVAGALAGAEPAAATGSRLLSGHSERWDELESDFARWIGTEAALFFTSGYLANIGLLAAVLSAEDTVFSDGANHASLIDGIRLSKARRVVFPHLDSNFLEDALRAEPATGARFIVVESVFSMEGDRAPLAELAALAERHSADLIVDEAHAIGVFGPGGRGAVAEAGLTSRVFAVVCTCGKALASSGAFVCGSATLRQFLINRARTFIFSTALPPYFAAHVRAGWELAAEADAARARLAANAKVLRDDLRTHDFDLLRSESQIVPVVLGENEKAVAVAEQLRAAGFGVRAIRPPTVAPGTARLRISVTARHSESVLRELAAAIEVAATARRQAAR
ncbi:MAG TPA: 8-amino-7-oxononanoate synthase [Methylomirabilota bacterium]|nr:8-amino-7-oxononanoate synthase [Methylomirabilota bacterium]